ncbi:hypothetical protein NPIL_424611 [Nephila pilipes]|uniref:Transmembrane protein n=1 Tax=Nephila pilipes TaxID=299642 RepID=A0A8X6J077_NEPPI|nr:hypothetical protein NPIL_468201 [Nephila pilipes]GFS67657.1 hypothetical protein NPIL_449761 [Nephila pilipes]GFS73842.1 hypothetical protein NPIL_542741 [Nephila pilipes]GFU22221.1 hypothetical protein NPIL_424611 [Nephila pilipes]
MVRIEGVAVEVLGWAIWAAVMTGVGAGGCLFAREAGFLLGPCFFFGLVVVFSGVGDGGSGSSIWSSSGGSSIERALNLFWQVVASIFCFLLVSPVKEFFLCRGFARTKGVWVAGF